MNDVQIELVKEALLQAELKELSLIDELPDAEFIPSPVYVREKKKLISKYKKSFHIGTKFIRKRVAIALIAVLVSLILMVSISAIREPIVKYIVNIYDEYIIASVDKNNDNNYAKKIENVYLPTYMPDGYNTESCIKDPLTVIAIWTNGEGIIRYTQNVIFDTNEIVIDNNGTEHGKMQINGIDVYYFVKYSDATFRWNDDKYTYSLRCPYDLDLSEVKKIIASIEDVKE